MATFYEFHFPRLFIEFPNFIEISLTFLYAISVETEIIRLNLRNGKTLFSDFLFKLPDFFLTLIFSLKFPDFSLISRTVATLYLCSHTSCPKKVTKFYIEIPP